jgi:hypothetical protein
MGLTVDVPPVDDGEAALTLMFHHLQLAAAYFEATPSLIELKDIPATFSAAPIRAWLAAMEALYPEDE